MNLIFSTKTFIFLLAFTVISITSVAQLPADLSKVKASQITDAQLQEFVKKAAGSGMTESQITDEFSKRGLPSAELDILRGRINNLQSAVSTPNSTSPTIETAKNREVAKEVNLNSAPTAQNNNESSIFGAELFSTDNLTFAPNLRIPTPKNYIVGTDDELMLEVSGVNITQQLLKITPEGVVNIKYAGPITVSGLTIEEAKAKITNRLIKFYPAISSGQTKVQLLLTTIRSNRITFLGALKKPGTYNISSLATLFNALYVSGGPTNDGSFRNIQVIRNNKTIVVADLYDFLLRTDKKSDIRLEDNDIVKIPFAETRVKLRGNIKRQGIFEVKKGETLENILQYAGGFNAIAYKGRITGIRLTDFEKEIIDLSKEKFSSFTLVDGDEFTVGEILDKYENKIAIQGAVFKPGNYALVADMTIEQLLKKAEGLKEDAFTKRVIINRKRQDFTKEIISISLDSNKNFLLQKNDEVVISSIFDIRENFTVSINGAVKNPTNYPFEDSLTLKTIILQAGGFTNNATTKGITIARRKRNVDPNKPDSPIVDIITINDAKDLSKGSADILLQPFDIITVKVDPYYKQQISVSIQGEVLMPGTYTLTSRQESITNLISRAGGILYTANIAGARIKRKNNFNDVDLSVVQKIAKSSAKDSSGVVVEAERKQYNEIAIDLPEILKNPSSKADLILEEGDIMLIPLINNLVSVNGEVFNPLEITFSENKSLKKYLSDAGGITKSANKGKIFVVYPNGKAGKIKRTFIFFKKYPEITAGTKIFVPKEQERKGTDFAKTGLIISGISALITAFALAYQITK